MCSKMELTQVMCPKCGEVSETRCVHFRCCGIQYHTLNHLYHASEKYEENDNAQACRIAGELGGDEDYE